MDQSANPTLQLARSTLQLARNVDNTAAENFHNSSPLWVIPGEQVTDDALKTKISTLVSELAKQEQERLAQAGTFIELEELTVSIGDMVSRELTNTLLSVRSEQVSHITHHPCPDCGKEFEILEQEHVGRSSSFEEKSASSDIASGRRSSSGTTEPGR